MHINGFLLALFSFSSVKGCYSNKRAVNKHGRTMSLVQLPGVTMYRMQSPSSRVCPLHSLIEWHLLVSLVSSLPLNSTFLSIQPPSSGYTVPSSGLICRNVSAEGSSCMSVCLSSLEAWLGVVLLRSPQKLYWRCFLFAIHFSFSLSLCALQRLLVPLFSLLPALFFCTCLFF